MAKLILVRHGITDWNKEGKWHGQSNISINEEGKKQAEESAEAIKDIPIDKVYTSTLIRTKETYRVIKNALHLNVPEEEVEALNERDYGIYTGQNKWKVKEKLGEEEFNHLRRDWDYPIPNGESLKDVYLRVLPFYKETLLPELKTGKNVLLVSSGNTLRALTKELDNLTGEQISQLELNFGEVDVYTFNDEGNITQKERRVTNLYTGKH